MKKVVTAFFLLIEMSCRDNKVDKINHFVNKYDLNKYDTICAISCISCGGCIESYVKPRSQLKNTIFIFDDDCKSHFIESIKDINHISIKQNILDSNFNYFGNIILIVKENNSYKLIEKPTTDF
jgi:hypothetical protein